MKRKKYNKFVINTLKMVIANIEIGKYVPSNVEFNVDIQQLEEDMKYPAFAVVYHYRSQRANIELEGKFSSNLKVVYVNDEPYSKERIMGLNLIGYWCGIDVDPEFLEFVRSRVRG